MPMSRPVRHDRFSVTLFSHELTSKMTCDLSASCSYRQWEQALPCNRFDEAYEIFIPKVLKPFHGHIFRRDPHGVFFRTPHSVWTDERRSQTPEVVEPPIKRAFKLVHTYLTRVRACWRCHADVERTSVVVRDWHQRRELYRARIGSIGTLTEAHPAIAAGSELARYVQIRLLFPIWRL